MSDRAPGFVGRPIEDVQNGLFLGDLPRAAGRWRYRRSGLLAEHGTLVLFQFRARVIALATFLRDEPPAVAGAAGTLVFEPTSIRVFRPIDADGMRAIWPSFRAFGHVKQQLNPTRASLLRRRLRQVRRPSIPSAPSTQDRTTPVSTGSAARRDAADTPIDAAVNGSPSPKTSDVRSGRATGRARVSPRG